MAIKTFNEKIVEISEYLQKLACPEFSSEVETAVKKEDKASLLQICKRANVPTIYAATVVSVLVSASLVKWPVEY